MAARAWAVKRSKMGGMGPWARWFDAVGGELGGAALKERVIHRRPGDCVVGVDERLVAPPARKAGDASWASTAAASAGSGYRPSPSPVDEESDGDLLGQPLPQVACR